MINDSTDNNKLNEYYFYHDRDNILEIFREIKNKKNRKLNFKEENKLLVGWYDFYIKPVVFTEFVYKDIPENSKEFGRMIKKLTDDDKLKELVNQYEQDLNKFYKDRKKDKFFEDIHKLYENIVNENHIMNKKGMCGDIGCITRFMDFRFFVSDSNSVSK